MTSTRPTAEQSEAYAKKLNDLVCRMTKALLKENDFIHVEAQDFRCALNDVSDELLLELAGSCALLRDRVLKLENLALESMEP